MTVHDSPEDRPRWGPIIGTQLRVVSALIRREMRAHFGESRMGYLWALIEPLLHLGVLMLMFTYIMHRKAALGTSTLVFISTGVVPYFVYSKIANYISTSVAGNRALLTLPPVKLHDVIVARVILEAATYIFMGVLVFFALFLNGLPDALPYDLLPVIEACGIAIMLGSGIGMINMFILSYFHNWMTFFSFLSTPLWFLSGLWYIPDEIPEPYRSYLLYNPLAHIIMLARSGFYREFRPVSLDLPYVFTFAAVALALGLTLVRVGRRNILAPV